MSSITIKDGSSVVFVIDNVTNVNFLYDVKVDVTPADGSVDPIVDHNKTVFLTITVDFDLVDKGAYDSGEYNGVTGSIFQQREFLLGLKNQASAGNDSYTLVEDYVESGLTSSYNGCVKKIAFSQSNLESNGLRDSRPQGRIKGSLVFVVSNDVLNF